jgi:hypothetical protein
MLAAVNDSDADARALGALLADTGMKVLVNLIPYNPTDATPDYARSADERTESFQRILVEEHGLKTYVRRTMGTEVAAACGQLVKEVQRPHGTAPSALRDIEDAAGQRGLVARRVAGRSKPTPASVARRGLSSASRTHSASAQLGAFFASSPRAHLLVPAAVGIVGSIALAFAVRSRVRSP